MRIPRIHTTQALAAGETVELETRGAHYLINVLRLKQGAPLVVFNDASQEFTATVYAADRRRATLAIIGQQENIAESRLVTILGLGLSRGERMDWAVQKSTELGVNLIVPLITEFCEVRLDAKRADKRQAHWQQIAISACEQSGRVRVPQVLAPQDLGLWLDALDAPLKLLLDQAQDEPLDNQANPGKTAILIGPEGGLSENEKTLAKSKGFSGFNLGSRTLRTETAPVVALALLQHWWGR